MEDERDEVQEAERPEAPEVIAELAGACVAYVHRATAVELDYTSDTLPLLDHYLQGAAGSAPEVRAVIATAAGAYFGEVLRGAFPARWMPPTEEDDDVWRLSFEGAGLSCAPSHFAEEAMTLSEREGEAAGFNADPKAKAAIADALSAMGEVPEDEYFLLATRYDVIESVLDRVMARQSR